MTDAVDANLAEQGFRLNGKAPDFLVSYQVSEEMRASITLTLVHADSRQRLWQGDASDEAYPARNPDAWESRLRTAVDRLLEQFPPSHRE